MAGIPRQEWVLEISKPDQSTEMTKDSKQISHSFYIHQNLSRFSEEDKTK